MVYHRTARSEEVREASRTRILEAATTLFARRGYDATTMQQIVDEAGTSIGNAYFYFSNKEQLLLELVEAATLRAWDRSELFASSIPRGPHRIGAIISANVAALLADNRDLARLIFATEGQVGAMTVVRDISIARWQPILAENIPDLAPGERVFAASAIFGANRTIVEGVLSGKTAGTPAQVAKFAVRWALRGLRVPEREIDASVKAASRRAGAATKKAVRVAR